MSQIYLPRWSMAKRLDHCGGGVPVSQFWWAGVSNPFISFQQSPALCRVQPTRVLGSHSKNIYRLDTREKSEKSLHKYSDWITHVALRPSSDYWAMQPTQSHKDHTWASFAIWRWWNLSTKCSDCLSCQKLQAYWCYHLDPFIQNWARFFLPMIWLGK